MIVLDTHVWLWWTADPRRLSRAAARALEGAEAIGVTTITVLELAEHAERGRVRLNAPLRTWVRHALARERVSALPLTAEIAVDAAQLRFEGDPADRIIYATARALDAQLVTRDERLRAYDAERTVW